MIYINYIFFLFGVDSFVKNNYENKVIFVS